jgi:hypothetical protein
VQSVLDQRFADWELIVSDDQPHAVGNKAYIEALETPQRIRYVTCPHSGQASNLTHGISVAQGHWIKPLYDDDLLDPHCLARFALALHVLSEARDVWPVLVACGAKSLTTGTPRSMHDKVCASELEVIAQHDVHRSMYLQDVDIGIPSQVLVRGDVAGRTPMTNDGFVSAVDTVWFARLLQHGDLALLNEPLIAVDQGGHTTITSSISESRLDDEMKRLRRLLRPMVQGGRLPDEQSVIHGLWFMRGVSRLKKRRWREAFSLWSRVRSVEGWIQGGRWLLRRLFPGRFHAVPRRHITLPFTDELSHDRASLVNFAPQ